MNDRAVVSFAVAVLSTALHAASPVSGPYNTTLGYLAGTNSAGDRVSAVGAGAYGKSGGGLDLAFVGAAAGAYSTNNVRCVGVGYHALRRSNWCSDVVAIGNGALSGASNVVSTTWINGQFYASPGEMWIKDRPTATNAIVQYTGGTLYLNAPRVVFGDGTSVEATGNVVESVIACDYYVSASAGSDFYDGLTPQTPFATIDKALETATNHQTVGVLAGSYPYPAFYDVNMPSGYNSGGASKPIALVAVNGRTHTFIDKALTADPESARISGCATNSGTLFTGFTFRGVKNSSASATTPFSNATFIDCAFEGMAVSNRYAVFTGCAFDRCDIDGLKCMRPAQPTGPLMFNGCTVSNTSIRASAYDVVCFAYGSILDSCMVDIDEFNSLVHPEAPGHFYNCTVLASGISTTNSVARLSGCLVGMDGMTNAPAWHVDCIVTNRAAVAAAINPTTKRSTSGKPAWRFYGYGSAEDRALRDAVADSLGLSPALD